MEDNNLSVDFNNSELKKVINVLNVMNFTDEERDAYGDHLKWIKIEANILKKYDQKGRKEGKEEIVLSMLKQKIDESVIKLITGFSQEEINKLKTRL